MVYFYIVCFEKDTMLVTLVLLMFALSSAPLWAVEITVQDADVGVPLEGAPFR
ncbi:MAG: hypothetical protein LBT13_03750 [Treponema sp.]|jgi:hypothetical protein|nr:hypothetical protein [Treponema sp.]